MSGDVEEQFEKLGKIFECILLAETVEDLAVCETLQEEYDRLYSDSSLLQSLQSQEEFNYFLDVFDCYMKAETPGDVDQCTIIAETLPTESLQSFDADYFNKQMESSIEILNCYINAETKQQLEKCKEMEAQHVLKYGVNL